MKSYEIHIEDIKRILLGEVPAIFLIEVILRTAVIYIILMVSMRMMGKRMSSQLARNELAAMVSLAAAVGVPIQAPDRGLLPVVIIALVIITFQQIIAKRAAKNEQFEQVSQGDLDILVSDGKMDLATMRKTRITRERLLAELRFKNIKNLGEIKRFYLEANGSFSVIKYETAQPGLSVIPERDEAFRAKQEPVPDTYVCNHCGNIPAEGKESVETQCGRCGHKEWVQAVK